MKNILVIGGTRFFGRHLVNELLKKGYSVTIATRGKKKDDFDDKVRRIIFDRYDERSIKEHLSKEYYDIVYDNLAYSSYDIEILIPNINYGRYIVVSSTAVYCPLEGNVSEQYFDGSEVCFAIEKRNKERYAEGKRLVEAAIKHNYSDCNITIVRFPFVIGFDDYTKRLNKYISAYVHGKPIYINNAFSQMSFIGSQEAGCFLAFLADIDVCLPVVNAASDNTISICEILSFLKLDKNVTAFLNDCLDKNLESAPYNDINSYSIDTSLAKSVGFIFSDLKSWINSLIEYILQEVYEE